MAEKKKAVAKQVPVKLATAEEKKKALDAAIAHIEKQYGKGAVMKLGKAPDFNVDAISTGSMTLDMALGIGGVPRGRIVEIYGPESSGKTTVALHVVAQAQKLGGEVAFIDVEHALDPVYAQALGVDIDNLLVSQPDSGEQALEIAEALVRSGAIESVIIGNGEHIYPKLRHIVAQCRGTVEPWICGRLVFVVADKGLLIQHSNVRPVKEVSRPRIGIFKIIAIPLRTPCRLLVYR